MQRRFSDRFFNDKTPLSPETFNPIIAEFDRAISSLEDFRFVAQEQVDLFNTNALKRFNDAVKPVVDRIQSAAEGGFLVAQTNDLVEIVEGEDINFFIPVEARVAFRPTPFLSIMAPDEYEDWAIGRTLVYNEATGLLTVDIIYLHGSGAERSGWTVSASSGIVEAVSAWLTQTVAAKDFAIAKAAEALASAGAAAASAATALNHKNAAAQSVIDAADQVALAAAQVALAAGQVTLATNQANTATAQAGIATTKAAEAAASAASIAGGPVTSVNYKTGVAFLDPTDVTGIAATLDLDFTNINGAPFSGNLTRATAGGYRQNGKGILVPTVANEPVIDFSAGTALGTGFYGAYTQLALWAEDFGNAAWNKSGTAGITSNAAVAPDGTTTADRVTLANGYANRIDQGPLAITGGSLFTFPIWLKSNGAGNDVTLQISTAGGTFKQEVSAKTITSEWARYDVTITTNANNTGVYIIMYGGGSTTSFDVWGGNGTPTAFPVPYVPTTSATVVRNADSMVISGTDFADFFNPLEGTLFVDAVAPVIGAAAFPWLYAIDDGGGNNKIGAFVYQGTGAMDFVSRVSGSYTGQCSVGAGLTSGQAIRSAASYKVNEFRHSVNGGSPVSDVSGALPAGLSRLVIGSGDAPLNSRIRRLIYWPKAHTATELQRMTA
jgi:hypothetical protein